MNQLTAAQATLLELDTLALKDNPLSRLHPLSKLLVTVCYLLTVVSFPKYDLSGLLVMILYPALLFQLSGVPVSGCFYRLRLVLPLVCMVGLANPFLDHQPLFRLGGLVVTGGMVSMLTLLLKGVFALTASFLMMATTKLDDLCAALRRLRVPKLLVTLLLLTYRYVSVLLEEAGIMMEAYQLRAPNQKGVHISAWGSFLGQLLLRSMDRAEELYQSMQLRGFTGAFDYVDTGRMSLWDGVFVLIWLLLFVVGRWIPVAELLGSLFVR